MQHKANHRPLHTVVVTTLSVLTASLLLLSFLPFVVPPVGGAVALTVVAAGAHRPRWWRSWPPPGVLVPIALIAASRLAWVVAGVAIGRPLWLVAVTPLSCRVVLAVCWMRSTNEPNWRPLNRGDLACVLFGRPAVYWTQALSARSLEGWARVRCGPILARHASSRYLDNAMAALGDDKAGAVVPLRASRCAPLQSQAAGPIWLGRASDWLSGMGWWLPWHARRPVMAPPEACAGIIMQPRSGKTSGIVAPTLWCHAGPAVATGVRADIVWMTAPARALDGPVAVLVVPGIEDVVLPPGTMLVHWDLLCPGIGGYLAIREVAEAAAFGRARAGSASTSTSGVEEYFVRQAGRLVAIAAWWAGRHDWDMSAVRRIVAGGQGALAEILDGLGSEDPAAVADDIATLIQAGDREWGAIMGSAASALDGWATPPPPGSVPLDPDQWLSQRGTLYVVQPERLGSFTAPVAAGAITHLRQSQARRFQADPSLPRLLLALDELANVAPLPDLGRTVTTGAGSGTIVLAVVHSVTQLESIYGVAGADAILAGLHHLIVGEGISDPALLGRLSRAGGVTTSTSRSRQFSIDGSATGETASASPVPRWPEEAITRPPKGHATLVVRGRPVDYLRITMAHEDPLLRYLAGRMPDGGISQQPASVPMDVGPSPKTPPWMDQDGGLSMKSA